MKNILLVDDDSLLRLVLLSSFRSHLPECNVLTAENGGEAVEILKCLSVDFVVTDLRMDGMNGYELIEYLKENYPSLPLTVMSGDGSCDVKERLERLGVASFFEKPFNVCDLEAAILEGLERGSATGEPMSLSAA
jgi:CheY-like chemotaxis protein